MTKIKCFYCSMTMANFGISVKCPNCPNSPTYNEHSPDIVYFNDVKKDGVYRAEYNIKTNITKFFIKKELPQENIALLGGTGGNITIQSGIANTPVGGPIHVSQPFIPSKISFNAHFGSGGNVTITAGTGGLSGTGGNVNITGGDTSSWHLLTEFQFQITPTNIKEVLDKCLKLKAFL